MTISGQNSQTGKVTPKP